MTGLIEPAEVKKKRNFTCAFLLSLSKHLSGQNIKRRYVRFRGQQLRTDHSIFVSRLGRFDGNGIRASRLVDLR